MHSTCCIKVGLTVLPSDGTPASEMLLFRSVGNNNMAVTQNCRIRMALAPGTFAHLKSCMAADTGQNMQRQECDHVRSSVGPTQW